MFFRERDVYKAALFLFKKKMNTNYSIAIKAILNIQLYQKLKVNS